MLTFCNEINSHPSPETLVFRKLARLGGEFESSRDYRDHVDTQLELQIELYKWIMICCLIQKYTLLLVFAITL